MSLVIEGAHVVTVIGEEFPGGHVVVEGNRITAVGAGAAPACGHAVLDGRGCLLTPGFVNTHNHLYQWVTRGLAVDATLFEWLTTRYPVWAGIDEQAVHTAASGAPARLLEEVRHALLFARAVGGPTALTVRDALELATMGGAAVLGRSDEIGSIEVGKLADLALWRIDGLAHADVADPVAALVLGSPPFDET
jgi:cytosine/adenosine deaminase-related metal-dependent hydrolase